MKSVHELLEYHSKQKKIKCKGCGNNYTIKGFNSHKGACKGFKK